MAQTSFNKHRKGRPTKTASKTGGGGGSVVEVVTELLGSRGDALASVGGENVYIGDALAGERLSVSLGPKRGDGRQATLLEVLTPSPDRVTPPCPHFGVCGGCALQHATPALIADFKRRVVVEALGHRGLEQVAVAATVSIPPGTRRRATFGYRRTAAGLVLGFNERGSDRVVDITECLVLRPDIAGLLPKLRVALAPSIPAGAGGDIAVTASDAGADVRLDLPALPDLPTREALAAAAVSLGLARLTLRVDDVDEPLAVEKPPTVTFADVPVSLPIAAFLQPSAEGEAAILALIEAGLEGADGPVADLFSGLGTFSLPLAKQRGVTAFEGDAPAATALNSTGRVKAQRRDLFREPILEAEWRGLAAVVMDPPRAGANSQADALARGKTPPQRVVYVSCNPATFARDARILVDGGYTLTKVTPVDQFPWSAHVELVGVFDRPPAPIQKVEKYVSLSPGTRRAKKANTRT